MRVTGDYVVMQWVHATRIHKQLPCSPKNDVFSLGAIIFHMMAGKKGCQEYWDARQRPNFSAKIQQEFIGSVRNLFSPFELN